ncbi:MAG: AAA family ATPase, partial [Firmicutes bacterium]|nr:AAA family ATPase [Bacillota bacterium]
MLKEILLGVVLAVLVFLGLEGLDVWPLLFFLGVGLFVYATGLAQRLTQGRPRRVVSGAGTPAVTFQDIGGQTTAKHELQEALEFLRKPEAIAHLGIRPLKGILLVGPPGTGKTLLAKAAAQYTDSAFLAASGSEFIEVYAGVGAQRVRQLFAEARSVARREGKGSAIIFIDELEVMAGRRGQHHSHLEYDQTLNQLLVEMDGMATQEGDVRVLVMGATNRADLIDPALLRPGRFDRVVQVELPDREARLAILQLHTRNKPLADDVDLEAVARDTYGFSGAHLESVCNEAAILALREGSPRIRAAHLAGAVEKVMLGERIPRSLDQADIRRVAIHEGGHALV